MQLQAQPETACMVVLDWFAPHLDERIDDMLMEGNNGVIRIGGTTPDVQTGDTHRHGPFLISTEYLKQRTPNISYACGHMHFRRAVDKRYWIAHAMRGTIPTRVISAPSGSKMES